MSPVPHNSCMIPLKRDTCVKIAVNDFDALSKYIRFSITETQSAVKDWLLTWETIERIYQSAKKLRGMYLT
jgi:hypothetical protein